MYACHFPHQKLKEKPHNHLNKQIISTNIIHQVHIAPNTGGYSTEKKKKEKNRQIPCLHLPAKREQENFLT